MSRWKRAPVPRREKTKWTVPQSLGQAKASSSHQSGSSPPGHGHCREITYRHTTGVWIHEVWRDSQSRAGCQGRWTEVWYLHEHPWLNCLRSTTLPLLEWAAWSHRKWVVNLSPVFWQACWKRVLPMTKVNLPGGPCTWKEPFRKCRDKVVMDKGTGKFQQKVSFLCRSSSHTDLICLNYWD